jgi:hypothetical protein
MPFRSEAQNAWAHTPEGAKALGGPAKVKEWEGATDYKTLPKRVPAHAQGGLVMAKGYQGKNEEFAKGGAVLGTTSKWFKDEDRFRGQKPPPEPERLDNFPKDAPKGQVKAPPAHGKSLKPIVPKK